MKRIIIFNSFLIMIVFLVGFNCLAETIQIPTDYVTIQEGIDHAVDLDMILVADGMYTGTGNKNLDFKGKAITVMSENGPDNCFIDCAGQGRGFHFHNKETSSAIVRGFTIQNGIMDLGGAIFCDESSPMIVDCILTGNQSTSHDFYSGGGGGINCYDSDPCILQCLIYNNTAVMGGGISCVGDRPEIIDCILTGNISVSGSGVFCLYDGPKIYHTHIAANYGCAIESWDANLNLDNCAIYGNSEGEFASGIYCRDGSSVNLSNCTVTDTVYAYFYTSLVYENSIQWETFDAGQESSITAYFSDMLGGCSGTGNIDADPIFVHGPHGGLYLSHMAAGQPDDSACIDAGSYPASESCVTNSMGTVCMDALTTRSDEIEDSGGVDMGYHYPIGGTFPTVTPIPTFTPLPDDTPTPLPSQTPTGVKLYLNESMFEAGDAF